jgi:hypothetical protein
MMKKISVLLFLLSMTAVNIQAQFYVIPDSNAVQLVNSFILSGVTASNVQYTGADSTLGHFNGGGLTNLGMTDGIAMTTGTFDTTKNPSIGEPVTSFACFMNGGAGDSLIGTLIPPWQTYDASILEFDLNPVGNMLEFQYVFASEEYPEYVGSSFNDVFGFFINGANPSGGNYVNANIAIIPGTSMPVAINNVNATTNSTYFVDNQALNGQSIIFDGFTTVLTAQIAVIPFTTYHLKMAISDVGDGVFDSGIFLKAQSMKSYIIVGMDETKDNSVAVYPNPVSEHSMMSLDLKQAGNVVINIFDHTGRLVCSRDANYGQPGNYHISIGDLTSALSSGIYMMGVQKPDGYSTIKIIKK